MLRTICITGLAGALLLATAGRAHAEQKFTLNAGYLVVRGEDARITDDVLIENLNFLVFDIKDFNNGTFGGEYQVDLGRYLEAGIGAGFYSRTVPTVYADFVDSDGTEIDQDLKLRIVPITALLRVFPLGQHEGVQPYVGGGLGIYNWRYSETGEFLDASVEVFNGRFVGDGTSMGPVALAGIRFAGSSPYLVGGEFRYHAGEGDLDREDFLTEKIDLGGYSFLFTFGVRF
jgi:hypothetical protein